MYDLQFHPCLEDPDLWMSKATKPDGDTYWEYVLIYVDDILVISHKPDKIMNCLSELYRLKEDPVTKKHFNKPTSYLGADIGIYNFPERGKPAWYMSSNTYVRKAVDNVQKS